MINKSKGFKEHTKKKLKEIKKKWLKGNKCLYDVQNT